MGPLSLLLPGLRYWVWRFRVLGFGIEGFVFPYKLSASVHWRCIEGQVLASCTIVGFKVAVNDACMLAIWSQTGASAEH